MGAPALLRLRAARLPRLPLRALAAVLLLAALLAGGWLWLRDSSLAEVRNVEVIGSTSSEEARIRAALEEAALDMSTLNVREQALRSAVAPFTSVADLRVTTDFPHGMRIEVVEHRPVAALELGGRRVPAAGSGLLLRGVQADRALPTIRTDALPASGRVENPRTRAALAVAGAAPEPLLARTETIWTSRRGLTAALADGPELIFGDASDAAREMDRRGARAGRARRRRRHLPRPPDPRARGRRRAGSGGRGDAPLRPLRPTLNPRVRIGQPSTRALRLRRSATLLAEVASR